VNAKQAKALRQELLKSPRQEVQVSRGTVFRTLSELQEDGEIIREYPWPLDVLYGPIRVKEPLRLINKPGTPRAVYRSEKKRRKNERR